MRLHSPLPAVPNILTVKWAAIVPMMSLPFTPANSQPAVTVEPHCRIAQRRDGGEHRVTQDMPR